MRMQDEFFYGYCARLLSGGAGDTAIDVEAFATTAAREGVAGLLLELPALAGPDFQPQKSALQGIARREGARELARTAEAKRVLELLTDSGLDVLVLKGAALACWLYPSPWQRPRCDLDLLVADMAAALRAVESLRSVGYELIAGVGPEATDGFEVALQRAGGIVIDLHWRLLNNAALARAFSYVELDACAQPLAALHPAARGLGRLHALFHALLHRVTNLAKGEGNRLIWLYDIHLLTDGFAVEDWRAFVDTCRDEGIAALCLDGLQASRRLFGTQIPADVEAKLVQYAQGETWQMEAIDQGTMNRAHLAALSWLEQLGWLRRKLFPSRQFMRYRYGIAGDVGLIGAYLSRWRVGIRRAFRRAA